MKDLYRKTGICILVLAIAQSVIVCVEPSGGVLNTGARQRVVISTDIGGSDPDDFQSLVHYLVYADLFDTEGIISSPPGTGRKKHILETIDAYEDDYPKLKTWGAYPTPASLRLVSKQGAILRQAGAVPADISEGAAHLIKRARANDDRPLYVLVWGAITDVAQAVHHDPWIKSKIRVYYIGGEHGWNTRVGDRKARDYLYTSHARNAREPLWIIETDGTLRGMYIGGNQSKRERTDNFRWPQDHVRGHGALGALFEKKKLTIKMGDTPSVMYLLTGHADDPTGPSWGGSFRKNTNVGPRYWEDRSEPSLRENGYDGAKTVNIWRDHYLHDWGLRMDRLLAAKPGRPGNQSPVITVRPRVQRRDPRSVKVMVRAQDSDNDTLSYAWTVTERPPGAVANVTGGMDAVVVVDTAGKYTFSVAINDGKGGSVTESVAHTISQEPSGLLISP